MPNNHLDGLLEKLSGRTWALQHNPNCPTPFLVRLVGKGAGPLDFQPFGGSKDVLGYGKTPEEAAEKALAARP